MNEIFIRNCKKDNEAMTFLRPPCLNWKIKFNTTNKLFLKLEDSSPNAWSVLSEVQFFERAW